MMHHITTNLATATKESQQEISWIYQSVSEGGREGGIKVQEITDKN